MSCGKPSRAILKSTPRVCTTSPCVPCPVGKSYALINEDKCCDNTDWIEYTPILSTLNNPQPTINEFSRIIGRYKIVDGNALLIEFVYNHAAGGSSAGSGIYQISLPVGIFADFDNTIIGEMIIGSGRLFDDTQTFYEFSHVCLSSPNSMIFRLNAVDYWSSGLLSTTFATPFKVQGVGTIRLGGSTVSVNN